MGQNILDGQVGKARPSFLSLGKSGDRHEPVTSFGAPRQSINPHARRLYLPAQLVQALQQPQGDAPNTRVNFGRVTLHGA